MSEAMLAGAYGHSMTPLNASYISPRLASSPIYRDATDFMQTCRDEASPLMKTAISHSDYSSVAAETSYCTRRHEYHYAEESRNGVSLFVEAQSPLSK